jgi:hypothetical protein
VGSTCEKVDGQILFRTSPIQHPVLREGEYGLERKPTVTLGTNDWVLLAIPRGASMKSGSSRCAAGGAVFQYNKRRAVTR